MGGKTGFRAYPSHLRKRRMRGLAICDASGFVCHADELVDDVRQGKVAPEYADYTPGFGTLHPQDVVQLDALDDPAPAPGGERVDKIPPSKQDLQISDAEVLASIREGRPPRRGY